MPTGRPTNLKDQLIRDEGIRHFPYLDTVGKLTLGCGRNISDVGISHATIEQMLDEDIENHSTALLKRFPWIADLDDARQGVLKNLAFNLGLAGISGFKQTLAAIQKGDYTRAAALMLQSKWARQVGQRAVRLAKQMETGTWQ